MLWVVDQAIKNELIWKIIQFFKQREIEAWEECEWLGDPAVLKLWIMYIVQGCQMFRWELKLFAGLPIK